MFERIKSWFSKKSPAPGSPAFARGLLNQAAQAFEAYKLARRDRPRESYQPHGYSGDAAIMGSQDLLHRRTRDFVRNNAQSKGIISSLTDLIVGTGVNTYAWPFAPSELLEILTELESLNAGELGPRLAYALESDDLFDEWFNDPQQFDIEGRLSGPEVQRMMVGESATVGNGFLIRCFRKDYKLVPLCFQLIEREQLDMTQDRPASEARGQNKIVGGIEFDKENRAVAYNFFLDHPQDFFGGAMSALIGAGMAIAEGGRRIRVTAERVIDLAVYHRPSASLGVSWLDACGQTQWDRDNYMESEIRSAAIDAAFAYVAKLTDPEVSGGLGLADGFDDDDADGNREYKIGHSPIAATIGKDEELEMVRSARPNSNAGPFIGMLDRDTAKSLGLSVFTVNGDYSQANFSSTRAAKMDEDLHISPLQMWFSIRVALPVRREFNAIAASLGLFTTLTPAEFRKNQRTYQRFDAIGNGRDLLDPYKEGEARTTRLATGISTFKEECARRGIHWIRQLMQISIERKVSSMFGVKLQFDSVAAKSPENTEGDVQSNQTTSDAQAKKIADRVVMLLEDSKA